MVLTYFFDTYAFYEIIAGNPSYEKFKKNIAIITTKLNLMELYYGLLVNYNKDIAGKNYDFLSEFCVEVEDETIKQAMLFRMLNKKRKLSYVDCVGYIIARQRNIKFLTGDEQFRDLPNVEFVK